MVTTTPISPSRLTFARIGKEFVAGNETVFDFAMTDQERLEMFGYDISENEYTQFLSDDARFAHLYLLFRERQDFDRANFYKAQIKSETRRANLDYTDIISL